MERSLGLEIKTTQILFGDFPISVYLMPDGKCRFSMRHLSKAIGLDEEWLIRTVEKKGKVLKKLKEYGFKGDISVLKAQNSIEGRFISATDFMAVIMYAAFVLMDRTAIAFLATSFNVGLEHLAVRSLLGQSVQPLLNFWERLQQWRSTIDWDSWSDDDPWADVRDHDPGRDVTL